MLWIFQAFLLQPLKYYGKTANIINIKIVSMQSWNKILLMWSNFKFSVVKQYARMKFFIVEKLL